MKRRDFGSLVLSLGTLLTRASVPFAWLLEAGRCKADVHEPRQSAPTPPRSGRIFVSVRAGKLTIGALHVSSIDVQRGEYIVRFKGNSSRGYVITLADAQRVASAVCKLHNLVPSECQRIADRLNRGLSVSFPVTGFDGVFCS